MVKKKAGSSVGLCLKNYHCSRIIPHLDLDVTSATIYVPKDIKKLIKIRITIFIKIVLT